MSPVIAQRIDSLIARRCDDAQLIAELKTMLGEACKVCLICGGNGKQEMFSAFHNDVTSLPKRDCPMCSKWRKAVGL